MEALVIARGHPVAGGANMGVVDQEVLGTEVAIQNSGQQQVRQPAFEPVGLVHQLVAVNDADRAGQHADAKEDTEFLPQLQMPGPGHVPERRIDQNDLDRQPDPGDQTIPEQVLFRRFRVRVLRIAPQGRVQDRIEPPGAHRRQQQEPTALRGRQPDRGQERQRQGKGQGAGEFRDFGRGNHDGPLLYPRRVPYRKIPLISMRHRGRQGGTRQVIGLAHDRGQIRRAQGLECTPVRLCIQGQFHHAQG